jgi:hypothetical protein
MARSGSDTCAGSGARLKRNLPTEWNVPELRRSWNPVADTITGTSAGQRTRTGGSACERGQRGYPVTGGSVYLEPCPTGVHKISDARHGFRRRRD